MFGVMINHRKHALMLYVVMLAIFSAVLLVASGQNIKQTPHS